MQLLTTILPLALAVLLARDLRAEPSAADKSLATELFKQGRTLLEQGQVAEACRKLAESQRLDPGGGTLLNLALCHEQEGRTATAWAEFTEALGMAKRDGRAQRIELAEQHIAALEPKLSRLVIVVPPSVEVEGLAVKRDGSVIGRAAWGTAMPVDPGEHVVEVSAPGKEPFRTTVVVAGAGESKTLDVPSLTDAPVAPASAVPNVAAPPSPAPSPAPSSPRGRPVAAAWTATSFGVAGVAAGSYFGLRAMSKKRASDEQCPAERCTADGALYSSQAQTAADAATVCFALGALGLGLGTYLFLRPSSDGARAVRLSAPLAKDGASVVIDGAF